MGEEEQDNSSDGGSDSEAQQTPKGKVKLRQVIDSSNDDSDDNKNRIGDDESGEIDIMDAGYGSEDDEE